MTPIPKEIETWKYKNLCIIKLLRYHDNTKIVKIHFIAHNSHLLREKIEHVH